MHYFSRSSHPHFLSHSCANSVSNLWRRQPLSTYYQLSRCIYMWLRNCGGGRREKSIYHTDEIIVHLKVQSFLYVNISGHTLATSLIASSHSNGSASGGLHLVAHELKSTISVQHKFWLLHSGSEPSYISTKQWDVHLKETVSVGTGGPSCPGTQ
jgi:hypothetical protein